MVSHDCVRINSLNVCVCHIVGINIADKCKCRILCQFYLEFVICFFTYFRIIRLTCLCQILINQFVGISGIVCTLVCTKYLVSMVICIKRASPADEICHLSAPVNLCRNFNSNIHTDLLKLLCCNLRNIYTNLVACSYTDHEAYLFTVAVIVAVITHFASSLFQNCFCLFRIVVVMLYILIVINISLKRSVSRHSLSQKNCIDNGLSVHCIAYCRNKISVFLPVLIPEVEQNSSVV